MLNQVMLIGRVVRDVEVKELESGNKVANITIAVQRSYKNENGIYECDFIDCTLWSYLADKASEWCRKGDLIVIRGRLQTRIVEKDDIKSKVMEVVVEKISFLSSGKGDVYNYESNRD